VSPRGSWVPAPNKARWVGLVGVLLSLVLVGLGLRAFPLAEVGSALGRADPVWLGAAVLLYLVPFPLRGLRWATLLESVKPVSTVAAIEVFSIGTLANNVMPARLGDVARAFVLAKREQVSASSSFATIMLERVFDGVVVVGMLLAVLVLHPPGAAWVEGVAWVMGVVFSGAIVVSALLAWNEARALALAAWMLRPAPPPLTEKILGILGKLARGLHTLRSLRATLVVVVTSVLIWGLEAGVYGLVLHALGLEAPAYGLVLVMAVLTLGLTAPSAPAFVGVFEGLVIAAVGLYGITGPSAAAYALAMHAVHFVVGTGLGLASAWRLGLRVRELRAAEPLAAEASSSAG
jgi:uncharacterized protein (TIRG00374 family)